MKKCVLCSNPAIYAVKDTSEYYCEECALENFAEIEALTRLNDQNDEPNDLQEEIDDI